MSYDLILSFGTRPLCDAPHPNYFAKETRSWTSTRMPTEHLLRGETPTTDPNQRHAQQLATFLSLYRPLVDGLVKEFFLDGYWTNLPASWRAPLDALSFQDLADLLLRPTCSAPPGVVWPLSLLAFMATAHA